jgi:hypothetical protein
MPAGAGGRILLSFQGFEVLIGAVRRLVRVSSGAGGVARSGDARRAF